MAQIGALHFDLGQLDVALVWYQRARAAYEKLNAPNSSNFGSLLVNIGNVYFRTNNLPEALAYYARAEAIFGAVLPPDHPNITECMHNIAVVNAKLGNTDATAAATAVAPPPADPRCSAPRRAAPAS